MAQGKKFTETERKNILESLKPYLQLDYSLHKSYILAFSNLKDKYKNKTPDYTTIQKWIKEDETLSIKVQSWRNSISSAARRNWANKVYDGDYNASKEWLERRERDDFYPKSENKADVSHSFSINFGKAKPRKDE